MTEITPAAENAHWRTVLVDSLLIIRTSASMDSFKWLAVHRGDHLQTVINRFVRPGKKNADLQRMRKSFAQFAD